MSEKGTIIILILSMLVPFYWVFIKHDEFFILLLIEIAFMAIIGLMYVALVFLAMWTVNAISRLLYALKERIHGKK
jgi:hypothetical protein